MKKTILAAMTTLTVLSSLPAEAGVFSRGSQYDSNYNSDWDYFWLNLDKGLDPKINGWDDFWYNTGITLDPANTGWDDFWGQCQDPTKGTHDCAGVVMAGIAGVIALPAVAFIGLTGAGLFAPATAPLVASQSIVASLGISTAVTI